MQSIPSLDRSFSFMVLGALGRPTFTTLSATFCVVNTKSLSVLHLLGLLLFLSLVAAPLTHASKFLSTFMRLPHVNLARTLFWQNSSDWQNLSSGMRLQCSIDTSMRLLIVLCRM